MDIRVAGKQHGENKPTRLAAVGEYLFRVRRRLATLGVGLLALWLAFRVVSGPNGWIVYHQKKLEYQQLQQEVQQLQKENEELERRVQALKNDPEAIEKEAREQLRYAKPGEVIYVLPEQKAPVVQKPQSSVAQNK